jgi:hypothetical protein
MDLEYGRYREPHQGTAPVATPSPGLQIGSAVGKQPALNSPRDQTVILDLLGRISPADGGSVNPLPAPTAGGEADYRLANAIFDFQLTMSSRGLLPRNYCDARVDPNGKTLALLNRFAAGRGDGGGRLMPIDPSPPKKGPGFLQSLFSRMAPRPTNWRIAGTATISLSLKEFGVAAGKMTVLNTLNPGSMVPLVMAGGGLSLGPYPGGVEIAPSDFPSMGLQIHAGPRTRTTRLTLDELLGPCLLIGVSVGAGGGGNATTILFNIGTNRSLQTLGQDLLLSLGGPNSFLLDAFNTCRAFGSVFGVFGGFSVGVSLIEALLRREGSPDIRPDPDVRRW